MILHNYNEDFEALSGLTAQWIHLPIAAVKRDYYIVLMLKRLSQSDYSNKCVFKGGTSLSKCYSGSIERFSEDIDLTYLGMDEADKTCEKAIKQIISIMTVGANLEKIKGEGNARNKSRKVWFDTQEHSIKLEIGSSVRPDPYGKRVLKSYIHSYLQYRNMDDDIKKFELTDVEVNTLAIERTFIDKIMSVKRHAICGTLGNKVRHIYDVVRLFDMSEIHSFISNKEELKRIIRLTKDTDSIYLEKRNISPAYNPTGLYDFNGWRTQFEDRSIREVYEKLHINLLYTDERQNFDKAISTFEQINSILAEIGE